MGGGGFNIRVRGLSRKFDTSQDHLEVQVCSEWWFWEICALVVGYLGPTPLAAHVAARADWKFSKSTNRKFTETVCFCYLQS